MTPILGINYYFGPQDYADAVFKNDGNDSGAAGFVKQFKRWMEKHYDVTIHTWDNVDYSSPAVKHVLYFDYSWRYAKRDQFLARIPFEKRALMMIEPANVNPSLYYMPWYRNRFSTIFTWDWNLLKKNPQYKPVNVPVGAEPANYRENRFAEIAFDKKKLLIAVSGNHWSYMPQSTYKKRKAAYAFFDRNFPNDFDLFGYGWGSPAAPWERYLGCPHYQCYRGTINGNWDAKVNCMARYKFALCLENNASQPGYISEKITDCFCARCVPIYYGSKGVEKLIPPECFINLRDFDSWHALANYLTNMTCRQHAAYIRAIDCFMHSPALDFFSTEHYFTTLATGLGLANRFG